MVTSPLHRILQSKSHGECIRVPAVTSFQLFFFFSFFFVRILLLLVSVAPSIIVSTVFHFRSFDALTLSVFRVTDVRAYGSNVNHLPNMMMPLSRVQIEIQNLLNKFSIFSLLSARTKSTRFNHFRSFHLRFVLNVKQMKTCDFIIPLLTPRCDFSFGFNN